MIWLTHCSIAVDLRIRGEFGPPALTSDESVLISHPRIGYVVAYGTAALVATVRGNACVDYGSTNKRRWKAWTRSWSNSSAPNRARCEGLGDRPGVTR